MIVTAFQPPRRAGIPAPRASPLEPLITPERPGSAGPAVHDPETLFVTITDKASGSWRGGESAGANVAEVDRGVNGC